MPSDDLDQMGPIDHLVVDFPGSRKRKDGRCRVSFTEWHAPP
jgi:hypothetical protein